MSDASNVTEELLAATAKIAELEATVADLFASVDTDTRVLPKRQAWLSKAKLP